MKTIFVLLLCTFIWASVDAVTIKVSGYDPMANLLNITCYLDGSVYSESKEVQWSVGDDNKYFAGCNPTDCMSDSGPRYKFTPQVSSITITIQPINFETDERKWTCTLDNLSDSLRLQFYPMPNNAETMTQGQMGGTAPGAGVMPITGIVTLIVAFFILILVIVMFVLLVRVCRRMKSDSDPEAAPAVRSEKKTNGKPCDSSRKSDSVPLLGKSQGATDSAAKADAELIQNSVRDHRDKIKGISEEMKKTEKVATELFESAKEVEGLAVILVKIAQGERVAKDEKGYEREVDPKEALQEELQGEIKKRGDRLKSLGAEYENEPEIVLSSKSGIFTETQTLINDAKKYMNVTKQSEGELRDFSRGTKKVLITVQGKLSEIRQKMQRD